jgi:hypothetical protein
MGSQRKHSQRKIIGGNMSSFGKSLVELVQGTINAGIKVPFTEEELKDMGVKIPKSKLSLAKKTKPVKFQSFQLPEQLKELKK